MVSRRSSFKLGLGALGAPWGAAAQAVVVGGKKLDYRLKLDAIRRGYVDDFTELDAKGYRKYCWVHARAGAIPATGQGVQPSVVLLMQKLLLSASDVFYALTEMRTDDMGRTWRGPVEHESLGRRKELDGVEAVITAVFPAWHAKSRKLLAAGSIIRYKGEKAIGFKAQRDIGYSVYDPAARTWSSWSTVQMPGKRFFSVGADSCQRVDLPNGEILLPVYYVAEDPKAYPLFQNGWVTADNIFVTVLRCSFDGTVLRYLEHGNEFRIDYQRGLGEPSLTHFQNKYYLTMRNDMNGYVATGTDGLHFGEMKPWVWDNGYDLGNYNTQQHWVTHSDGLYLVYTRRGANNDHVFRHRAPLFMARVDPQKLCVIRETERALVPERGARLGNFGVVNVNKNETWVTVTEYMQPPGCERHGSDNSVFAARIQWDKPNLLAV